jgi:hypothetical protein
MTYAATLQVSQVNGGDRLVEVAMVPIMVAAGAAFTPV